MTINFKALQEIENYIKEKQSKLLIVTKTRTIEDIIKLINMGYKDFAENRVQETQNKFSEVIKSTSINLNLIGPLQSNKVKQALSLFDNIQSVDRKKIVNEILKHKNHKTKTQNFFIQVNIGNETQKSGVLTHELDEFYLYCKDKNLDIKGLMCIPPADKDPAIYFEQMLNIKQKLNEKLQLSMGMSSDYKIALNYKTDIIRVGSLIFS